MSSWWTIGILAVFVVGYVAAALVPVGGRYLWQSRLIDSTQQAMLSGWPLIASAILLAVVLLWSATRRLPWRWENLGAFVAVLGLAMVLVTQSLQFRNQTTSVAAVPVSTPSDDPEVPAELSLAYTTRAGDTTGRILVVMVPGSGPMMIPLDTLPRWNDAAGDAMPPINFQDEAELAQALGFGNQITATAYIADGTLIDNADGTQTVTPTPADQRNTTILPYPDGALLALELSAELEDGSTATTTVWLPFEPGATDSMVPRRYYQVQGLGTVALSFRPMAIKLPFAIAASPADRPLGLGAELNMHIADTNTNGQLLQPETYSLYSNGGTTAAYRSLTESGSVQNYQLHWTNPVSTVDTATFIVTSTGGSIFVFAGLATFLLGVALDRVMDWLSTRPTNRKPKPTPEADGAAA